MSTRIDTNLRELRKAVKLSGDESFVVSYEPFGHLSVRLLDASGTVPLALYAVSVDIPGEGKVSLKSNRDGKVFHPDVPFQDYELELEGDDGPVTVFVPAVAARSDVHDRHVPTEHHLYVDLELRTHDGSILRKVAVTVEGGGKSFDLTTDEEGRIARALPVYPASYRVTHAGLTAEVELPVVRTRRIVTLPEPT
jgi:hypothetical protein